MNSDGVIYFDSFGVKYIHKETKKFIGDKNIMTNIYRIKANDSMLCGYFCIGFIDFMLEGEKLLEYTNLFSPMNKKVMIK